MCLFISVDLALSTRVINMLKLSDINAKETQEVPGYAYTCLNQLTQDMGDVNNITRRNASTTEETRIIPKATREKNSAPVFESTGMQDNTHRQSYFATEAEGSEGCRLFVCNVIPRKLLSRELNSALSDLRGFMHAIICGRNQDGSSFGFAIFQDPASAAAVLRNAKALRNKWKNLVLTFKPCRYKRQIVSIPDRAPEQIILSPRNYWETMMWLSRMHYHQIALAMMQQRQQLPIVCDLNETAQALGYMGTVYYNQSPTTALPNI